MTGAKHRKKERKSRKKCNGEVVGAAYSFVWMFGCRCEM